MSALDWLIMLAIAIAAIGASAAVCIIFGRSANDMGSDDRDNTRPADLWQGHERRKVRAGETK